MGNAASNSKVDTTSKAESAIAIKQASSCRDGLQADIVEARKQATRDLRAAISRQHLYSNIELHADEEHSSRMDEFFNSFDKNKDGHLGQREMLNLIKALGFDNLTDEELDVIKRHGESISVGQAKKIVSMLRHDRHMQQAYVSLSGRVLNGKVFLGGACGKSTWRKDIAIPMLEAAGISYFNPQVAEWRPELVEIEAREKAKAAVLLFVIDDETAGISSLIEAAEYAAGGERHLAVMLKDVETGSKLSGEERKPCTIKDLNRGRTYLADVLHRTHHAAFKTVEAAVKHSIEIVKSLQTEE